MTMGETKRVFLGIVRDTATGEVLEVVRVREHTYKNARRVVGQYVGEDAAYTYTVIPQTSIYDLH
jgi:hypothetical protein